MEFYTWLDFISGFGCLFFAVAYTLKRASFHPERRLMFLFVVLGVGFILRGWSDRDPFFALRHSERAWFSLFPLAAALYVEQMARLKLPIFFKLFVLIALPITACSFAFDHGEDARFPLYCLFTYEMITLGFLMVFSARKIFSIPCGIERSITIVILVFLVSTVAMVALDWYFVHALNLPRASSLVVFPFCYFAFRISYAARGFSNRRAWRDAGLEIALAAVQATVVHLVWNEIGLRDSLMLAVIFLDFRIFLRTVSMIANDTEDQKSYFSMAQINALSREDPKNFLGRLSGIENVQSAKFIAEREFRELGLEKVYAGLFETFFPCSREEIFSSRLALSDNDDLHAVARMQYALDAFRVDFLYAVPGTRVCFGLRFADYNRDAAISERAYAIFTQASLMMARNGRMAHG